jgi:hypothetical protein
MLEEVLIQCRKEGVMLVIASANAIVEECFQHTGFIAKLGTAFTFNRVHEAVKAVLLDEIAPEHEPLVAALTVNNATPKAASTTTCCYWPWYSKSAAGAVATIEDRAVFAETAAKKEAPI